MPDRDVSIESSRQWFEITICDLKQSHGELTDAEIESLRFQTGTTNTGRGGRRYLPYAFTEQGVASGRVRGPDPRSPFFLFF